MAGIYVHIPYCHSKCAYCDFYSTPAMADSRSDYARAVAREWQLRRHELRGEPVATIYVGGGTPSLLTPEQLSAIVEPLPRNALHEFTVEANPEDVSGPWVASMAALGVNRVSVGVQSLNDGELRAVGRRHSAAQALQAIDRLRQGGIANVSADLIYGLPGQTLDSWQASLRRLLAAGITHLSAYALSYEPGTRLSAMLRAGRIAEAPQELSEAMYRELCLAAAQAHFVHYEISNFALPGYQSRHNSSYWTFTPYLGLGPGAHSFDGALRRVNPPRLKAYLDAYLSRPQPAAAQPLPAADFWLIDEETPIDRANDLIITSLRTDNGLALNALAALNPDYAARLMRLATPHLAAGRLAAVKPDRPGMPHRLRIPEAHWLVADAILRDLLLD